MKFPILYGSQRGNRILFGSALIAVSLFAPVAPLGWVALLPLLATYPIFAGLYGYDPLLHMVKRLFTMIRRGVLRLIEFRHPTQHS